jgi:hypothetical protein
VKSVKRENGWNDDSPVDGMGESQDFGQSQEFGQR